jgi:hypothetical protein
MALYCVGCGLEVVDGELGVKLNPSACDHQIVCDEDGLRVQHTLNRLVLRNFNNTQIISPPGGIIAEEPYGAQYQWDNTTSDVSDGTGLSHVGHTVVVETPGLYLIGLNFRVRAANIALGVGQHMLNFNIRINGVRRGGDIRAYAAPYSHRSSTMMTSKLAEGDVIDAEFADQPVGSVLAISWQMEPDARNELSVVRLQSDCPIAA